MDILTATQGDTAAWEITLRDDDGQPILDTYAGDEPLALVVWAGDTTAAYTLADSSLAWEGADGETAEAQAALGRVTLTLDGGDLATLTPGIHRMRAHLTTGGERRLVWEGLLDLAPSPAATAAPTTYCDLDDMLRLEPTLRDFVSSSEHQQSDFAEERHEARLWLEGIAMSRAQSTLLRQAGRHAEVEVVERISPTTGVDFGPLWGPSTIPDTTLRNQLDAFQGYLDDDKLMTGDGMVRRITAHYAVGEVLGRQLGGPKDTSWREIGDRHHARAARLLRGYTLKLDTSDPADGVADWVLEP